MDSPKIDVKEVMENLGILCKGTKFTFEEHTYMQAGLKAIQDKLDELEKLKAPKEDTPKKD